MQTNFTAPCNECPFRKTSAQGYLGPWDALQLLDSLAYEPFPCHQTIGIGEVTTGADDMEGCAGAAIFLNNKFELSRNGTTRQHQDMLEGIGADVSSAVFASKMEFLRYHVADSTGGARQ